jgi:transcriptional regulator CtsR
MWREEEKREGGGAIKIRKYLSYSKSKISLLYGLTVVFSD